MSSFLLFSTFFIIVILLPRVCSIHSQGNAFDLTLFGNISRGTLDITEALEEAWSQACATKNGVVLIPNGTFLLNVVKLAGPCNGSTTFLLYGDLKASTDASIMKSEEWVLFDDIIGLYIIGNGSFNGQGEFSWHANQCKHKLNCKSLPTSIILKNVKNALIQGISSINSKMFHMTIKNSESIIIENITIQAPHKSPNTDGIHISRSNNINIYNTNIGTGDDCISLSQGSTNVFIYNVTCGPGHGISVGSLGRHKNEEDVSGIIVKNCTFTNTTNGARIKTWAPSFPSRVFNITFQDIILNHVKNPILIDEHYCPNSHCKKKGASDVQLSHIQFINFIGTSSRKVAVTLNCSSYVPCGTNIVLADLDISYHRGKPTTAVCTNFYGKFYECKSPITCVGGIAPAPVPAGGVKITPTPGGGVEIAPTPSGGIEITPTPSGGVEITPTPGGRIEIAPTPDSGVEITPTPGGGVEVTPTPGGRIEISPTPNGEIEITPTPNNRVEITTIPSSGVGIVQSSNDEVEIPQL